MLSREDCLSYAQDTHRKDGELKEAYRIGADPDDWIAQNDEIVRAAEKQREEDELEARENQDQLEDDEEADDSSSVKPQSKKRAAPKPSSAKSKSKKPKADKSDGSGDSKAGSAAPRKSVGAGGDDEGADGEVLDEDTKRVRNWRHALQRAFLPKDRAPTEEDVKDQDAVFTKVEEADITADQLKATKIGKVMRKIVSLDSIPLDAEHSFKKRAEALVNKWNAVQHPGASTEATEPSKSESTPQTESAPKAEDEKPTIGSAAANGETNGASSAPAAASADADVGDLTELKDDEGKPNGIEA